MASLPREALQAATDAQVIIRRMVEVDVPKVAESERLSYAFPWSEGIFRDCIRAGYHCRVMEIDEQFAAYAVLSTGAGEAHVLNVCVRPEYRFRGLGRRMMEHLFDVARSSTEQRDGRSIVRVAGFTAGRPAAWLLSGCTRSRGCDRDAAVFTGPIGDNIAHETQRRSRAASYVRDHLPP